jgi:flagellar P-ring protein FlgI
LRSQPDEDVAAARQSGGGEIEVYPRARVVVNERTGTVVIGGTVRLQPVSILHGGLSVNVITRVEVSQPNALSSGTTQVVEQTTVQAQDKPVNRDRAEGRRHGGGFGPGIATNRSGSTGCDLDPAGHEGSWRA